MIGEDPNGIPNNLMPFVTKVAKGQLEKLSVFGNDYDTIDGTGVRDYIHVVDLAKGHVKAIENLKDGVNIYNLGTGRGTSVLELVNAFMKVNDIDVPYEIKELIKPLGIEWNNKVKTWFMLKGFDVDSVNEYINYLKKDLKIEKKD